MAENVVVRIVDFLPVDIHGMVVKDSEDYYNVYINSKLSFIGQQEALAHELEHILQGHFDMQDTPVTELEKMTG